MTSTWQDGYKVGFQAGLLAGASLPEKTQQAVVGEYVRAYPGLRSGEISKQAGIKHASVRTALYRLMDTGKVKTQGGKWFPVINGTRAS